MKKSDKYSEIQYIRKSKVPLIKFVASENGVQIDISVDKADGIEQLSYVSLIDKSYPEFKYLVFVFKCLLKIRSLSDTYTGGVGSFLLTCMILAYLEHTQRHKKYYTLGEHIIKFMSFYGEEDWSRKIIVVRRGIIEERER